VFNGMGSIIRLLPGEYTIDNSFDAYFLHLSLLGSGMATTTVHLDAPIALQMGDGSTISDLYLSFPGPERINCVSLQQHTGVTDQENLIENVVITGTCRTAIFVSRPPNVRLRRVTHEPPPGYSDSFAARRGTGDSGPNLDIRIEYSDFPRSVYVGDRAQPSVIASTLGTVVIFDGGSLDVAGSTVGSVMMVDNTALRVRGSVIGSSNASVALEVYGANADVDLGRAGDPGLNQLTSALTRADAYCQGTWAVLDARPPRDTANGKIILLTGSTLNGTAFPAGTKAIGPTKNETSWCIKGTNNRLAFEPATWP
jgi:hypothetical protein